MLACLSGPEELLCGLGLSFCGGLLGTLVRFLDSMLSDWDTLKHCGGPTQRPRSDKCRWGPIGASGAQRGPVRESRSGTTQSEAALLLVCGVVFWILVLAREAQMWICRFDVRERASMLNALLCGFLRNANVPQI